MRAIEIDRGAWLRGMDDLSGLTGTTLAEALLTAAGFTEAQAAAFRLARDLEAGDLPEPERERRIVAALAGAGISLAFTGEGAPADVAHALSWGTCQECDGDLGPDGVCEDAEYHDGPDED